MKKRKASVLLIVFVSCLAMVLIVSSLLTIVLHQQLIIKVRMDDLKETVLNTYLWRIK